MNNEKRPKAGVIDCLTAGFRLLARFPWLLALPLLLDLALWFGPQVSVRPLATRLIEAMQAQSEAALPADYQEMMAASRETLLQLGEQFNLLTLLANGAFGMPSLAAEIGIIPPPGVSPVRLEVTSIGALAAWLLALLVGGVILSALYLTQIANQLRAAPAAWDVRLRRLRRNVLRLLGVMLIFGVALLLLSLPLTLVIGGLALMGGAAGALFAVTLTALAVWWVRLCLVFLAPAIVLDEVGIRQGILLSVRIAISNLTSTLGLVLTMSIIGAGFSLIWQRLVGETVGAAAGILGNAIVGTGLLIGVFIFYRDRMPDREAIATGGETQRGS